MIYVDPHRDQSGDRRTPGDDPEVVAAVHQAERALTRLVACQIRKAREDSIGREKTEESR